MNPQITRITQIRSVPSASADGWDRQRRRLRQTHPASLIHPLTRMVLTSYLRNLWISRLGEMKYFDLDCFDVG